MQGLQSLYLGLALGNDPLDFGLQASDSGLLDPLALLHTPLLPPQLVSSGSHLSHLGELSSMAEREGEGETERGTEGERERRRNRRERRMAEIRGEDRK